jgi:hypothetical protein
VISAASERRAEAPARRGLRPFTTGRLACAVAGFALVAAVAAGCGGAAGAGERGRQGPPTALALGFEESGRFGGEAVPLGRPVAVRSGPDGRVYVGDALARRVLVFAPDGRLLGRIGADGRGRGGLLGVHALEVTKNGSVFVVDGSQRRITRFDRSGRPRAIHPLDPAAVLWPRRLLALDDGGFLLAFRLPERPRRLPWPRRRPILHRFDAALAEEREAFAVPGDGGGAAGAIEEVMSQADPGSVWLAAGGDVLWAPRLYHGRVVRYLCGAGDCGERRLLAGWVPPGPAWREVAAGGRTPDDVDLLVSRDGAPRAALFRHESRGLFELADGGVAHFTLTADGDERRFGVERFDATGRLAGYAVLARRPLHPERATPLEWTVLWKDAADAFYLADGTGEAPVVRRVRLVEED